MSLRDLGSHLPHAALLAAIPLGLLALPLLGLRSLVPFDVPPTDAVLWDAVQQDTPWKIEAQRAFAAGRLPLYQHGALCGSPLLANDQVAALYPGNAAYLLTDAVRALGPTLALHLVLASLGAYALLLRLGGTREGGVVAGASLALSSAVLSFLPHPQMTAAMALAPWVLWASRGAATAQASALASRVALLAAIVGLSVLSGHLQYTALTLLAAGALLALPGRRLAPILGMGLGLAMGAVQLLPTLEYAGSAARKPLGREDGLLGAYEHSLPLRHLPVLAWPEAFGNPDLGPHRGSVNFRMYGLSIGFVPLALLLGRPRGKAASLLAALALLALLLALGTPLYGLLHALPGWSSLKPARCLALFTLAASTASGLALPHATARRGAAGMALLVAAAAAALPATPAEVRDVQVASLLRVGSAAVLLLFLLARAPSPGRDRAVALLAVVELLLFARPFVRTHPLVEAYPQSAQVRELRQLGERFSAARFDLLLPNTALALGLEDARGTDSFIPGRYHELVKRLDPASDDMVRVLLRRGLELPAHGLLAPVVVGAPAAQAAALGLQAVGAADLRLHRDPRAPGAAFFPEEVRAVGDAAAARELVLGPSFAPGREAVVEGPERGHEGGAEARVGALVKSANRISLDVDVRAPALLVVLSGYQPGFRAVGLLGEHPVAPADSAFLGVWLPAGETHLELRYEPASFRLGLFASGLAGTLTLALFLGSWRRRA